ncbi:ABC transporter ATP-binding protein [Enterococcus raffinosus]|uniref:ABC transporter ATP-binding protein n=1 Tax=Enterococcus raffinosus TaxID=71452 RepID=UPI001C47F8B6|nr:ABC transporter ATP-binding protein [Enterococcus raffinosus]MDT2571213.1 ABC transporter ATP-binding protein [Enterococcus raffinosus]QXJ61340.1 ABC transporter ATP-binding protein [Enterococcus raffinosus]
MKKMIVGTNIEKSFGQEKVLRNVSVEIEAGEFVSIMGPSGSGKTTLMFALSGMDEIDGGSVQFDGKELVTLSENALADLRRKQMGFVFQQPTLLKNLNVLDNIVLPAQKGNEKQAGNLMKKGQTLMEKMGIAGLEQRDITQVSGGQLQRAGICRALMGDPQIIFGDEPTGALNSKSAQEIMTLLSEINQQGTAICLVTHDAKVAAQTQRVLFMSDGQIVSEVQFFPEDDLNLEEKMVQVTEKMREIEI